MLMIFYYLTSAWRRHFGTLTISMQSVPRRTSHSSQKKKIQFVRREVDFVGFRLSWDDYKATSERLAAIRSFQMQDKPTVTDLRSWYGFVN